MNVVSLKNLSIEYHCAKQQLYFPIFKNATLDIKKGEFIGVLNSVEFLYALLGKPNYFSSGGEMKIDGTIAYIRCITVFNTLRKDYDKIMDTKVKDFIVEDYKKMFSKNDLEDRVFKVMEELEISNYKDKTIKSLSKAQFFRVTLAKGMMLEPSILLIENFPSNVDRFSIDYYLANLMKNKELTIIADFDNAIPQAFKLCDKIALFTTGSDPELAIFDAPEKIKKSSDDYIKKYLYSRYAD